MRIEGLIHNVIESFVPSLLSVHFFSFRFLNLFVVILIFHNNLCGVQLRIKFTVIAINDIKFLELKQSQHARGGYR